MKKLYAIPLILALLSLLGHLLLMGFNFEYFYGLSAIAIVIFGSVFLLRTHYSFGEMIHAFRCAGKDFVASREELSVAAAFFASARSTLIGTSLLGLVFGFIRIMDGANHGSTTTTAMTGFGVAAITMLYGLGLIVFLVGPFAGGIKKKLAMLPPG